MNITIRTGYKTEKGTSLILIAGKKTKWDNTLFSNDELAFLKKAVDKGDKTIVINQYSRHIAVVIIDEKKAPNQLLEACRKGGGQMAGFTAKHKLTKVQVSGDVNEAALKAFAVGLILGSYKFTKYLSKQEETKNSLKEIVLITDKLQKADLDEMKNVTTAVFKARDLINEPVNHLNAVSLAKEMAAMCKKAGIFVQVLGKKQIEALRMGGLLSVNQGSVDPPTFTIMEWKPKKAVNKKPLVLVGKGVVYDTGGLSLKPTQDSMDYMKSDMSGAAAVSCALYAIAKNNLQVHVVALVPATDNRPGFNAYAPGDIIKMFDGSTVEMVNSDAEGRMILADAISYAKKYSPELLINVATLTGSASVAVGPHAMVAMGTAPEKTMQQLKESGDYVFERIVEFPLWEEYEEMLKSDIADRKNVGGRSAGAIIGGKFLEHFAPCPFIHLDIAGVAFNKSADNYKPKGGVGVGVRLLYEFTRKMQDKGKKSR